MKFLTSLDSKDRSMLLIVFAMVAALLAVFAVLTPSEDPNRNPLPDSYLAGRHGAKAAFLFLQRSGYTIERWHQPLRDLAEHAGPGTTVVLAAPSRVDRDDRRAILNILQKGGRVVATNLSGGTLLPANHVQSSSQASFAACEASSEGFGSLAANGAIWIVPEATWEARDPRQQVDYACNGQPVVVEYAFGRGRAIWWASSTPLENGSVQRGRNAELLMDSVGPVSGAHIYWDESLHTAPPTQWSYVKGPVWPLLLWGSMGISALGVLSFSRRRGPIRPLPQAARTSPIEFLQALGGLYRVAGATSIVMQIALERFRMQAVRFGGLDGGVASSGRTVPSLSAQEIIQALERRFGTTARNMEADLIAAEDACNDEKLKPRRALHLVQALRRHEATLRSVYVSTVQQPPMAAKGTLGT